MAMRLAAITDEISQDFEHALDVMGEYGATGAELRGLWGTNIADLSDDQANRAMEALKARNMTVCCLSTPFFKCDIAPVSNSSEASGEAAGPLHLAPPRPLEAQMDILRRSIRLAHKFDTNLLRVFSFWRKESLTPEIEARIVEAFAEPVELASREGVTLVLENEHACFLGTGEETARVLGQIRSPHLRAVWDPGNAFFAGETPFPDGYEAIKPWLTHIHVKDGRMVDKGAQGMQPQWCVIGEGEIDYKGHFAALKSDDYHKWVSLETHYVPSIGTGESGKGTPEDGSRACLAALRTLMNEN